MTNQIYPCLWFDGNAKAAADFYCAVFSAGPNGKNSKITTDTPMVVNFELEGKKFMGLNGGPMFKINPSISFFVVCESTEEIDTKWGQLIEGGIIMMALNSYPWSERYGWCQDKFGVNWQLMTGGTMGSEKIIPSLMFTQGNSGKAGQAVDLYTSLFPGSTIKAIHRYEKGEPDVEGYIKHAQFYLGKQMFTAMDSSGPHQFTFSEGISLVVECDTQEEIDNYWNRLTADGGKESMCGWLVDKFGVSWQIIPAIIGQLMSDPEKGARVMQQVLKMKKLDIEILTNA